MEKTFPRSTIVLDTSVIALWFNKAHRLSSPAIWARNQIVSQGLHVVIPDLVLQELRFCLRLCPTYSEHDIEKGIATIYQMRMQVAETSVACISRATQLAEELGINAIEGYFVALAESYACEYWTLDEDFFRKMPPWSTIRLIKIVK